MNLRVHWAVRHRRLKQHRIAAEKALLPVRELIPGQGDIKIRLTRVAPKKLDSDNLAGSCKGIRDGIAKAIGIDDGADRLTWYYAQEKGEEYAVRVEIKMGGQ
jgi:hypothetical protein